MITSSFPLFHDRSNADSLLQQVVGDIRCVRPSIMVESVSVSAAQHPQTKETKGSQARSVFVLVQSVVKGSFGVSGLGSPINPLQDPPLRTSVENASLHRMKGHDVKVVQSVFDFNVLASLDESDWMVDLPTCPVLQPSKHSARLQPSHSTSNTLLIKNSLRINPLKDGSIAKKITNTVVLFGKATRLFSATDQRNKTVAVRAKVDGDRTLQHLVWAFRTEDEDEKRRHRFSVLVLSNNEDAHEKNCPRSTFRIEYKRGNADVVLPCGSHL
jgi:hypothetical protein